MYVRSSHERRSLQSKVMSRDWNTRLRKGPINAFKPVSKWSQAIQKYFRRCPKRDLWQKRTKTKGAKETKPNVLATYLRQHAKKNSQKRRYRQVSCKWTAMRSSFLNSKGWTVEAKLSQQRWTIRLRSWLHFYFVFNLFFHAFGAISDPTRMPTRSCF